MKSSAAWNFSLICLLTWSLGTGRPLSKSPSTPTPLNEWITYAPTTTPLNEWITYAPTTSPLTDSSPTEWIVPSDPSAANAVPLKPKDDKVHEAHGQVVMSIFLVDMVLLFVLLLIFLIWLYRSRLCALYGYYGGDPYNYHDLPTEEVGNPLTRLT